MLSTPLAKRQAAIYVALIVISLLLLALSSTAPLLQLRQGIGFAMAPIQQVLRDGTRQVTSIFAAVSEIEQLRQENADLSRRVDELEIANTQLQIVKQQNDELTALLNVRSALDQKTVAAEVISRAINDQERVISLDKGSDDGIRVDDPVVAGGGALVGQVVEVGPNFSRVMLLSDTRFVVAGMLETSRATGDVWGQLDRPLTMEGIAATETVVLGETVVTAGIDLGEDIRSPFPKGLLIGTVGDINRSPNQVVQSALVQPAAAMDRLDYVLVIIDYQNELEQSGESPVPTISSQPTPTVSDLPIPTDSGLQAP
jgi:rod shape-determining protein MreC